MEKDALEFLINLTQPDTIEFDGLQYSKINLHPIKDPTPEPLKGHTLTGLVDFIGDDTEKEYMIHIQDYDHVLLKSTDLGNFKHREIYMDVSYVNSSFNFNNFHTLEQFIISLQAHFIKTDIRDNILKIVGNVTSSFIKNTSDDGITQTVEGKTGITKVAYIDLPNPVTLIPYRTFAEIDQPDGKFILRLREDEKQMRASLFTADGDYWKNECINRIKNFYKTTFSDRKNIKIIA